METFRTPQLLLLHHVLELAKNISKYQEKILQEFSISHEQLNILIILHYDSCESALSLLEIQERMILSTTNTSRLVDKLKDKKLVERRIDQKNRRKVKIRITHKGIKLVTKAVEKINHSYKSINSKISDREATKLIKRISELNELLLDWH
ncbi:MarR family transcriptional regulator [uncultured Draconibacterium sp.]|uniref:MarR family winged helix-turn-helix transcriptional regulator n=1 Tax=uncultured Draconibacterium sp. TaxID=1573823 RepID=UPI002AA7DC36|nr:MarR family transcriptional regulator [uncultured Draconibacterium sp.]